MLKYWEQYNGKIKESLGEVESKQIYFSKKREDGLCMDLRKNDGDKHSLNLSYFVGVDWIPKTKETIFVEPKLNTKLKEDEFPENDVIIEDIQQTDYLSMLFSALKHPEVAQYTNELFEIKWNEPQIEITQQQDLITPLLVVQFLNIVQRIVKKGLKKSYYKVEHNLNGRVKGKILVGQTIKQNILKNKSLNTYCSYDEFGVNGLENRLIKKALVFVERYLPTMKNLNSEAYTANVFNFINPAFESVSAEVSLHEVKHTITNAFYKDYEEAIRLAKLILKRFGYNISKTEEKKISTPPFWIDMSKLFEIYVLGLLRERFEKQELDYQLKKNYQELDYLINSKDYKMVVDAKYKVRYQNHYKIEDIRQVSGYARLKSIYKILGKEEGELIDCLIIYPDQENGLDNLKFCNLKEKEIEDFEKVYKIGVKLPLLKKSV